MATRAHSITRCRPSLSCLSCRRRKIKCEKQQPACDNCVRLKEQCVYDIYRSQGAPGSEHARKKRKSVGSNQAVNQQPENFSPRDEYHEQSSHPFANQRSQAVSPAPSVLANRSNSYFDDTKDSVSAGRTPFGFPDAFSASSPQDTNTATNPDGNHSHDYVRSTSIPIFPSELEPTCTDLEAFSNADIMSWDVFTDKSALERDVPGAADPNLEAKVVHSRPDNTKRNGHLSVGSGGLRWYVGASFWALAGNRTTDCDLLLQAQWLQHRSKQLSMHNSSDLVKIVHSLPSKRLCDVLLRSFLLGVWPLIPIVHVPTFEKVYHAFWASFSNNRNAVRVEDFVDDISFLPLLWAVLCCGAVAASSSLLATAAVKVVDRTAFIHRLYGKLNTTLALCKFDKLPTISAFVALLLAQYCDEEEDEILMAGPFVNRCKHVARVLGLHREEMLRGLGEVEREIARRVWWHILHLEVQATITSGTTLVSSNEDLSSMQMIRDFKDRGNPRGAPGTGIGPDGTTSSSVLLGIGRYETTRVLRLIVERCYDSHEPTQEDLAYLNSEVELLSVRIDGLIARLAAKGMPERGLISNQLLCADPSRHPKLYVDDSCAETVFNAWARIVLSMLKLYVTIFFRRQFIDHSSGEQYIDMWSSEVQACCTFMQHFLRLARLPAFSPYAWFCPGKIQPLQECMLLLTYLKQQRPGSNTQLAHYVINEVFDMFGATEEAPDQEDSMAFKATPKYKVAWQLIKAVCDDASGITTSSTVSRDQSNGIASSSEGAPISNYKDISADRRDIPLPAIDQSSQMPKTNIPTRDNTPKHPDLLPFPSPALMPSSMPSSLLPRLEPGEFDDIINFHDFHHVPLSEPQSNDDAMEEVDQPQTNRTCTCCEQKDRSVHTSTWTSKAATPNSSNDKPRRRPLKSVSSTVSMQDGQLYWPA